VWRGQGLNLQGRLAQHGENPRVQYLSRASGRANRYLEVCAKYSMTLATAALEVLLLVIAVWLHFRR
jgi:hypothetical protein